jgi:hypothetical protein
MPLIQLPVRFTSLRQNTTTPISSEGYSEIFNATGPGCVRSIWFLRAENKRIEIIADNSETPQADMPLESFMGILLGIEPYLINSAPFVSLPNKLMKKENSGMPGYTCYLPIPFQKSCRIRIYGEAGSGIAAMVNWHKYDEGTLITRYRLHVSHNVKKPAPPRGGTMLMADVSGEGFIAGIFQGVIQKDNSDDFMYHQGGITWLIDGETDPHAIRGHNMEDDYGFTWGFHNVQTPWFGVPYAVFTNLLKQEAVVYRFLGPDPVSFSSSISMRVGTRDDTTETVTYYYKKDGILSPTVATPEKWQVTGTFPCKTREEFEKSEFPENITGNWPDTINFEEKKFKVNNINSEHTWINLHYLYCTPAWTPIAFEEQSVYARTSIRSDNNNKSGILRVAFDDWMSVWINGKKIATLYHEIDFKTAYIPVKLKKGENEILLKYVNFSKLPNNRLWAFSMVLDK